MKQNWEEYWDDRIRIHWDSKIVERENKSELNWRAGNVNSHLGVEMTTCRSIRWRRPNLIAIYILKFLLIYTLNLGLVLTHCLPVQSTATSKATTRMSHPILCYLIKAEGIPWWLSGKESACNTGDLGSICGSGRSPGGRNGNPIQDSCLGNPVDRGAWKLQSMESQVIDDLVTKSSLC